MIVAGPATLLLGALSHTGYAGQLHVVCLLICSCGRGAHQAVCGLLQYLDCCNLPQLPACGRGVRAVCRKALLAGLVKLQCQGAVLIIHTAPLHMDRTQPDT